MKKTIPYLVVALLIVFVGIAQESRTRTLELLPPQQRDPVVTFKLTLPQASSVIYALRNSTILDAKTANELADVLVSQANDTTLNKSLIPPKASGKKQ